MKTKNETVGQRIRRIRTERGMSQRNLATKGCSYGYLSHVEQDKKIPSEKALRVLADKLQVNVHELRTGEPGPVMGVYLVALSPDIVGLGERENVAWAFVNSADAGDVAAVINEHYDDETAAGVIFEPIAWSLDDPGLDDYMQHRVHAGWRPLLESLRMRES